MDVFRKRRASQVGEESTEEYLETIFSVLSNGGGMGPWLNKHLVGRYSHRHTLCVRLPWPLQVVNTVAVFVHKLL